MGSGTSIKNSTDSIPYDFERLNIDVNVKVRH